MPKPTHHAPKKHLGQHFLTDPHYLHQCVACLHANDQTPWLEIGPGLGALTTQLLPLTQQLTAIEKDADVLPTLEQRTATLGELTIIHQDALAVDYAALLTQPTRVVGNLPYQITSPLLFLLLAQHHHIIDMHFMVQKEVALRLAAQPGSKTYGRLSVTAQFYCDINICFHVPPSAFSPPPKVDSSFIRLQPKTNLPLLPKQQKQLHSWVRLAFQQRRKQLQNSLKKHLSDAQLAVLAPWAHLRPEALSVADFVQITQLLDK